MPTYGYRCKSCGHEFEILQKMSDAPLTTCPKCSGVLQKQVYAAGVIFKGSGYYTTDYKGKSGDSSSSNGSGSGSETPSEKSSDKSSEKSSEKSSGSGSQGSSEKSGDSKPAGESKAESKPSQSDSSD